MELEKAPPCLPAVFELRGMVKIATRKEGRVKKNATKAQPGDLVNTKCPFFLDGGRMPAAIRDQHLVPHGMLVTYKSYI